MSANPYTVSNLVAATLDSGLLPPADVSTSTARFIGFMNREQRLWLMKHLQSVHEDYMLDHDDVVLQPGGTSFPIPTRATGAAIKMVEVIANGVPSIPIHPIKREMLYWYVVSGINGGYYFEGSNIVLIQPGGGVSQVTSATLRITYFRRFGTLVPETQVGTVSNISNGVVTVDPTQVFPPAFVQTATYDFVQGKPPFDTLARDKSCTISGNVMTFAAADVPSNLAVGDFVCLAGQSPVCQAPLEFHDLLVQRALYVYLVATGHSKAATVKANLDELLAAAVSLIAPRVEAHSEILLNYNAPGWQRGSKRRRRRLF